MKTILTIFLAIAVTCAAVCAQTQKVTLKKFGESDMLVIRTQKGFSTLIEFPLNQSILEATSGDKEFWVIEGKGRFLSVKPAKEGLVTNLNVLVEGDIVYSFFLKEVSKPGSTKETADFRVMVSSVDELTKLRKEKEDLEEAIVDRERELKELTSKYEAEVSRATKKTIAPDQEPNRPISKTGKFGASVMQQATTQAGASTQAPRPAPPVGSWSLVIPAPRQGAGSSSPGSALPDAIPASH